MPNYVGNKLKIYCQDSSTMAKIKKMIIENNNDPEPKITMEILLPRSMAFADADTYDLKWNCAVWGTKWDMLHYSIIESGQTLTIYYNTAWSPNRGWVEVLCCYIDHYLGYNWEQKDIKLSVEHRYSDYVSDFGGIVEWTPGDKFQYTHYDSYLEYLKEHDKEGYQMVLKAEAKMKAEQDKIHRLNLPI
jgi:hypothetical protein